MKIIVFEEEKSMTRTHAVVVQCIHFNTQNGTFPIAIGCDYFPWKIQHILITHVIFFQEDVVGEIQGMFSFFRNRRLITDLECYALLEGEIKTQGRFFFIEVSQLASITLNNLGS